MEKHKRTVEYPPGEQSQGVDVEIDEAIERPTELRLRDGAILRMRTNVVEVIRLDEKWNENGEPVYVIKSSNTVTAIEVPQELKKKMN